MATSDLADIYPVQAVEDIGTFIEEISEVAPSILYVYDLQKQRNVWVNRSIYDHLGYSPEDIAGFGSNMLADLMHMEDLARYPGHFETLTQLKDGEQARFEYRMKTRSGDWRWLNSVEKIYRRNANGSVRQIIGSAHDVTDAREREIEVALMGREMSHRIHNLFAVVSSMIRLTGTFENDLDVALTSLERRVTALSAGHQPASEAEQGQDVALEAVARRVLSPHIRGDNFALTGDPVQLLGRQITPFSLLLNELATNSASYGALSSAEGKLSIDVARAGEHVRLFWEEHGGPPATDLKETDGFGPKLIESLVGQLGATLEQKAARGGLIVSLDFPRLGRV